MNSIVILLVWLVVAFVIGVVLDNLIPIDDSVEEVA
jgi:hypothetical protein